MTDLLFKSRKRQQLARIEIYETNTYHNLSDSKFKKKNYIFFSFKMLENGT